MNFKFLLTNQVKITVTEKNEQSTKIELSLRYQRVEGLRCTLSPTRCEKPCRYGGGGG